ncbi:MAG: MC/SLC25 family protein [Parachlamydia sp.]|nr:MC/SLC25 family protein [Parachlamydia sp.]
MPQIEFSRSTLRPVEAVPLPTQIPLTPWESALFNTVCKAYAVFWFQGVQIIKILKQAQSSEKGSTKFNWKWLNPITLYRGVSVTLLNAPLFGLMGMANDQGTKYLEDRFKRPLTQKEKALIAVSAATFCAAPWTTLDLMIVQTQWQNRHVIPPKMDLNALGRRITLMDLHGFSQDLQKQKEQRREVMAKKIPITQIIQEIWRTQGVKGLLRGFPETLFREVPFATALFWAGPEVKKLILPKLPKDWNESKRENTAKVLSGIGVGAVVTLATQAVDVTKTNKQKFIEKPEFRTTRSTVQYLWNKGAEDAWKAFQAKDRSHWVSRLPSSLSERTIQNLGGIAAMHVGLVPRMGVLMIATIAIMHARENFGDAVQRYKRGSTPAAPAP